MKLITNRITVDTEDRQILCEAHAAQTLRKSPLTRNETMVSLPAGTDHPCQDCEAGVPIEPFTPRVRLRDRLLQKLTDWVFPPDADPDHHERSAGNAARDWDRKLERERKR